MDQDEKFNLILKKLEENEKKLKALEKDVKKEETELQKEEKIVKDAHPGEDKFNQVLNKLNSSEHRIEELERRTHDAAEFSEGRIERFLSKKTVLGIKNSHILLIITAVAVIATVYMVVLILPGSRTPNSALQTVYVQGPLPMPVVNNETIAGNSSFALINTALTSQELQLFQNPNLNYYNIAALMILNGTIPFCGRGSSSACLEAPVADNALFIANNKTSVIYLGSTTCIYCGENRWAMALALSTFGTFDKLFVGYSAFEDNHVPTLFWGQDELFRTGLDIGNYYNSSYITFVSMEGTDPITLGFNIQPLSAIGSEISNTVYSGAFTYLTSAMANYVVTHSSNGNFQTASGPVSISGMSTQQLANLVFGTPQTVWGNFYFPGVSSVDFYYNGQFINNVTHSQIISALSAPSSQFAWAEYAGADMYIAALCNSMTNKPAVCSQSAISQLSKGL